MSFSWKKRRARNLIFGMGTGAVAAVSAAAVAGGVGTGFAVRKLIRMGQFSYNNGRLSTLGNPYVLKEELTPLIEGGSPQAFVRSLRWEIGVDENAPFREVDRGLVGSYHRTLERMMDEIVPPVRPMVQAFIWRAEGEEIKRLLRLLGRRDTPLFPVGEVTADVERSMLSSGSVPVSLDQIGIHPLFSDIKRDASEGELPMGKLDLLFDRACLKAFEELDGIPRSCRKGARALHGLLVDRYNVHVMLRGKELALDREVLLSLLHEPTGAIAKGVLEPMADSSSVRDAVGALAGTYVEDFLRHGVESGITDLEIALDRMLLEGAISISSSHYTTIGPTVRYLISLEMELRNLRAVARAVASGWEPDRARSLLVVQEVS